MKYRSFPNAQPPHHLHQTEFSFLPIVGDALRRPLFFIALLYSIAICYERFVEVEIFKPYRILGLILISGLIMRGKVKWDKVGWLITVYLAIGLIVGIPKTLGAEGREDVFLSTVLLWTFNVATYVAINSVITSRRDVIVLATVHSIALLTAAYNIAQEAAALEHGLVIRQIGDFKNPANATISMLFSCLVFLAAFPSIAGKSTPMRLLSTITICVVPVFLIYTSSLTGSRSGAALLIIGLLYYLAMRRKKLFIIVTFATALVTSIIIMGGLPGLQKNLVTLSEENVLLERAEKKGIDTDRLYIWKSGLDAWMDSYGLGLGIARYPEVHKEYFAPYADRSDRRWLYSDLTLHNDYITALVEHGVLGLLVFVMLCMRLVKTANAIGEPDVRAIALSLLLGIAINGLTHASLPYFAVWFYFALMSSWRRLELSAKFRPSDYDRYPQIGFRAFSDHLDPARSPTQTLDMVEIRDGTGRRNGPAPTSFH